MKNREGERKEERERWRVRGGYRKVGREGDCPEDWGCFNTTLTFQKINFLKYKHTVYQRIEFEEY